MNIIRLQFILTLILTFCLSPGGVAAAGQSFSKLTYIDSIYKQSPNASNPTVPDPQATQVQVYIFKKSTVLWPQSLAGLPSLVPGARPLSGQSLVKDPELAKLIKKYAQHYGVDPRLVQAMIRQESGFNATAVSPKGAMGLMQLMPETAASLGVEDPFNLDQNLRGGIRFLKLCLNRFNQNLPLALAAYNAGPGRVVEHQGMPPFKETHTYVKKIVLDYCGQNVDPAQIKLVPDTELKVGQNQSDEAAKPPALPLAPKPINLTFFTAPSPERLELGTTPDNSGLKKNVRVSIY
jgi:hypothetical protein